MFDTCLQDTPGIFDWRIGVSVTLKHLYGSKFRRLSVQKYIETTKSRRSQIFSRYGRSGVKTITVWIFVQRRRGCVDAWSLSWRRHFGFAKVMICPVTNNKTTKKGKIKLVRQVLCEQSKKNKCSGNRPPYGHPGSMVISLLRPLLFFTLKTPLCSDPLIRPTATF